MNIKEAIREIEEKLDESNEKKEWLDKETNKIYYRGRIDAFIYSLSILKDLK